MAVNCPGHLHPTPNTGPTMQAHQPPHSPCDASSNAPSDGQSSSGAGGAAVAEHAALLQQLSAAVGSPSPLSAAHLYPGLRRGATYPGCMRLWHSPPRALPRPAWCLGRSMGRMVESGEGMSFTPMGSWWSKEVEVSQIIIACQAARSGPGPAAIRTYSTSHSSLLLRRHGTHGESHVEEGSGRLSAVLRPCHVWGTLQLQLGRGVLSLLVDSAKPSGCGVLALLVCQAVAIAGLLSPSLGLHLNPTELLTFCCAPADVNVAPVGGWLGEEAGVEGHNRLCCSRT
ncbi:hypothetical protein HaLaN_08343 [Haematococcus lacustris]|uniref:Uncharacterized protein n=1 Tax=Haematococcus lacustris TaxID=44745 RepID=A0A699YTQ7_HAELA|nr:hypothetical protein HaLaN_08343 [Haematococcus lacustris]